MTEEFKPISESLGIDIHALDGMLDTTRELAAEREKAMRETAAEVQTLMEEEARRKAEQHTFRIIDNRTFEVSGTTHIAVLYESDGTNYVGSINVANFPAALFEDFATMSEATLKYYLGIA